MTAPVLCRYCKRQLLGERSRRRRAGPGCARRNRAALRAALADEALERLGNRPLFPTVDQRNNPE